MKLTLKNVLLPAIVLCMICFVVSGLLALTNSLTKDAIAQAQAQKEETSRMLALPDADRFEQSDDATYFTAYKNDEVIGYVFLTEAKGYSSTVKVMTGIDTNSELTGVIIVSQNETPGLGTNATNSSFTDQYKQSATEFEVIKGATTGDGKITALTGATITSKAVTSAVNDAVKIYETIKEGE